MIEFCLRCEKNLNKCQKNYEDKDIESQGYSTRNHKEIYFTDG